MRPIDLTQEYYDEPAIVSFYTDVIQNLLSHVIGTRSPSLEIESGGGWSLPSWPWKHDDDAEVQRETLKSLAKAIVAFEKKLSDAQVDPEDVSNPDLGAHPYFSNSPISLDRD